MGEKARQERAIVHLEKDGQHYYYGNLKALTDHWDKDAIGVSYTYLKNLKISEDKPYRNDCCCIRRGIIISSHKIIHEGIHPKIRRTSFGGCSSVLGMQSFTNARASDSI